MYYFRGWVRSIIFARGVAGKEIISIKSGVILAVIGVIIFGNPEVWGADWTYYADTGT